MDLSLSRIEDKGTRDALRTVQDAYNGTPIILAGFKLYELATSAAVASMDFYHNLGFIPKDVIVTRISGGTVTWSYDSFTKDKVVLSTTGATTIRFLLGSLE